MTEYGAVSENLAPLPAVSAAVPSAPTLSSASLPSSAAPIAPASVSALADFIDAHPRLFVLTGAGCSTESGIADYRDTNGAWKRPQPTTYQAFTQDTLMRHRYWARAMIGWRRFGSSLPNQAHRSLAAWEDAGRVALLVTQNVDGLHQAAGSRNVVDLHGRLDGVCCLRCGMRFPRDEIQQTLEALNPAWVSLEANDAPDGDADLEDQAFLEFKVPLHETCGGMLKPDVVFFGESVPRERVTQAFDALDRADAMLVVGSSLMVYSGYRFALGATERNLPIAAINMGHTRGDALFALKVEAPAGAVLSALDDVLGLP